MPLQLPHLPALPPTHWATLLLGLLLLRTLYLVIHRRYFHPLAAVPGPFLASVTHGYKWWFNAVRPGQLYREIERLHRLHGSPIIRISPVEVHLSDPADYDRVYGGAAAASSGGPAGFYKAPEYYDFLMAKHTLFLASNEEHKRRRAPLNPLFTRRAVLGGGGPGLKGPSGADVDASEAAAATTPGGGGGAEHIVRAKAEVLCRRMREDSGRGRPTDLTHGLRAVGIDVATEFLFGDCWDLMGADDFGAWWSDVFAGMGKRVYHAQMFPALHVALGSAPRWAARWWLRATAMGDYWAWEEVRLGPFFFLITPSFFLPEPLSGSAAVGDFLC